MWIIIPEEIIQSIQLEEILFRMIQHCMHGQSHHHKGILTTLFCVDSVMHMLEPEFFSCDT